MYSFARHNHPAGAGLIVDMYTEVYRNQPESGISRPSVSDSQFWTSRAAQVGHSGKKHGRSSIPSIY